MPYNLRGKKRCSPSKWLGAAALAAVAAVAAVAASRVAVAQIDAMPAYQGIQPDLVEGAVDTLATARPVVRHVYLAAPDTLAVVVDAGAILERAVVPFALRPGDRVERSLPVNVGLNGEKTYRNRNVYRDGKLIGGLVGPGEAHLFPARTLAGQPLDLAWADAPASYALAVVDGPADGAIAPTAVFRKSKPQSREWTDSGKEEMTARHELYLKFDKPLVPSTRYRLAFNRGALASEGTTFAFDDARLRTEAIHVNLAGYHPRDARKVALLSMWIGSGGGVDFSAAQTFRVVDDKTSATAFEGAIKLRRAGVADKTMPDERQPEPSEDLPASVYEMDFSSLATPGVYRVVVPGLGSSFPFRIDADVWRDAARTSARGYLHQRSGIALGPPYTTYVRPRNMHPADGFVVYENDPAIFYDPVRFPAASKTGNPFARIQAAILLNTSNSNAWGGWMDAGDFDRTILPQNHPRGVQAMIDLYESNPAFFSKRLALNVPESGDAVPDILDEACWCLDLFRRIQHADGGVPSSIESVEHPGEPSWCHSLPTTLTPPTPQTCYLYAAAASRMAVALKPFAPDRAAAFLASATSAMRWAAAHPEVPNIYAGVLNPVPEHYALAAACMYRATNDAAWHDAFRKAMRERFPSGEVKIDFRYDGPWAEAIYAMLPADRADAGLQAACRKAIVDEADERVAATATRPFALGVNSADWERRLGAPWVLIDAHRLTGDARYLRAIDDVAQFGLGLNETNACYTSGLGARSVVPFNLEAHFLGVPIPEGITTMGPLPRQMWGSRPAEPLIAGVIYPEWKLWPWVESTFDVRYYAFSEYTVGGSMANVLLMRAYVAQSFEPPTKP